MECKKCSTHEDRKGLSLTYDHQGNTAVLFTSATPTALTLTATFEGNGSDNSNQFGGVSTAVTNGSANSTAGGTMVVRMNQTVPIAVTKSLKVYAGDKIDLETYCYYEGSGFGTSNVSMATLINTVAGAFGGVSGGAGEAGKIYNGVNSGISNWGYGANQGDSQPSAYLNYILFDQQYRVMDMGWSGVPSTANFAKQKISLDNIYVKEAGYLFVYLSYETPSNNWVFFDDLKVTHTKTNVIQYNEYYAHGLQAGNSWTRENTTGNNFLANGGTELNTTSGLYDLEFRNFDPVLGRMTQMDPMSDKYSSLTPYNYAFNNPILFNDKNGADPFADGINDEAQRRDAKLHQYYSSIGLGDAYSMFGSMGQLDAGYGILSYESKMEDDARQVRNGNMSHAEYAKLYGETYSYENQGVWLTGKSFVTGSFFVVLPGSIATDITLHSVKDRWVDNWVLVKFQAGGVGQPGMWESLIPIWGSGRAAVDDFQNGRWGWGLANTALAISDVFLVKSLITAGGKLIAGTAFKSGSHSWKATRSWLGRTGQAAKGQEVHHWFFHQNQGLGKYVSNAIKNQPWNLMPMPSRAFHQSLHGFGTMNLVERLWYGTPTWFKSTIGSGGGRAVTALKD